MTVHPAPGGPASESSASGTRMGADAVDLVRADGTAGALWQAWTTGERLESLPELLRPRTLTEGFTAQQRLAERAGPAYGWKLAATAEAGQAHIGVDAPLPGPLFERFRYAPGDVLPSEGQYMAVAEAEFAFVMGDDVEAGSSADALRSAVASVHCAIEFPESRFADFATAGGPQLLADAACAGLFVLGPEIDGGAGLDLSTTGTHLWINGAEAATGSGAAVLGDPWAALAWLAASLQDYGVPLTAGSVVTTGTTTVPASIAAGDTVRATFGAGADRGEVTVTLAG